MRDLQVAQGTSIVTVVIPESKNEERALIEKNLTIIYFQKLTGGKYVDWRNEADPRPFASTPQPQAIALTKIDRPSAQLN